METEHSNMKLTYKMNTNPQGFQSGDITTKYQSIYEDNLNPFQRFAKKVGGTASESLNIFLINSMHEFKEISIVLSTLTHSQSINLDLRMKIGGISTN